MNADELTLTIPPPAEIERRIAACRAELKALSRLLRMSRAAKIAADSRAARKTTVALERRRR
jgi:hypothetical protein